LRVLSIALSSYVVASLQQAYCTDQNRTQSEGMWELTNQSGSKLTYKPDADIRALRSIRNFGLKPAIKALAASAQA
jgi:hypothetical protein